MGRRALLIAGCLAFGASACSAGAPVSVGPAASTAESTAESTPETTATSAEAAELDAKGLLAQVRPSIGLITTPISQGSGVLIEGGYIVTNAHVVDPHSTATITFEGDDPITGVPVVGIDPYADIMVLGPIETDRPPLPIASELQLEQGDPVYLVGYPGEFEVTPEVTLSSGLVSRLRNYAPFDHTYVQTDAAIGGGQSGGALLDSRGQVVGISGLSVAEEFALALSGPDVLRSVDAIDSGGTPPFRPLITEPAETSGSFSFPDDTYYNLLLLNAADVDRELRLTVPDESQPLIQIHDLVGELAFVNQRMIDTAIAGDPSLTAADIGVPLTSLGPNEYSAAIPAGVDAMITLATARPEGAEVSYVSSLPLVEYPYTQDVESIEPGDSVEGVIDAFELEDLYLLDLEAGQSVTIRVSAGAGDPVFTVYPPGVDSSTVTPVDDSGIGLNGLDAEETFTAEVAGTYEVFVSMADRFVTGYRLDVESG